MDRHLADVVIFSIAAGAALTGVAIGKLWDATDETKRWRRQQMAAAYAAFLSAADAADMEMSKEGEDFSAERLRVFVEELTRAAAQVALFGSKSSRQNAQELWNYAAIDLTVEKLVSMSAEELE